MLNFFIERPVFSSVIALLMILMVRPWGLFGQRELGRAGLANRRELRTDQIAAQEIVGDGEAREVGAGG